MTAYVALTQKVNDVDKYVGTYIPQVMPLLEKYGIEVLVAHFGAKAIEGSADSLIILRADSEEVVRPSTTILNIQARRHSATRSLRTRTWCSRRSSRYRAEHPANECGCAL